MTDEIKVGDIVETSVYVCGKRTLMWKGKVTEVLSGCCRVNRTALIKNCAPWIVLEQTSHLLKVDNCY